MAFAPDYATSGRFYVYFTDRNGDRACRSSRRSKGNPNRADKSIAAAGPVHAGSPTRTTTAGCCCSGPDGYLYIGMGDGGSAGDPQNRAQNLEQPARQDPADRPAPRAARYRSPPRTRSWAAPGATRSTPTGCGTPGASRSTARPATSTSATSGQDSREEIDYARARRRARARLRLELLRGPAPLQRLAQLPGPDAAGARVRARAAASARSRAAWWCATRGCPRSPAATSTATSARGAMRSFRIAGGKATGDRALGLHVASLSSFGEDARGRVYATSLNGPGVPAQPR